MRLFLSSILFLLLCGCNSNIAVADCDLATPIPFTKFGPSGTNAKMNADLHFCLPNGTGYFGIGKTIPQFDLTLSDGRTIVLGATPVNSFREIMIFDKAGQVTHVPLSDGNKRRLTFQSLFAINEIPYILAFDASYNLPEERRPGAAKSGSWLYRISEQGLIPIKTKEDPIFKVGIQLTIAHATDQTLVCSDNKCLNFLENNGDIVVNALEAIGDKNAVVLELAQDSGAVFALVHQPDQVGKLFRSAYSLCSINLSGEPHSCKTIPKDVIPWGLSVKNATPEYKLLRFGDNPYDLLRHDLSNLSVSGMGSLGKNNSEGPLAWGLPYYMNGLATFVLQDSPLADEAATRLRLELAALRPILDNPYPGLSSRRYSLDREPLFFALHEHRLWRAMSRAATALGQPISSLAGDAANDLPGLKERHIEAYDPALDIGSLRLRHYYPFWLDGVQVPWNFASAIISGYASSDIVVPERERQAKKWITEFMMAEGLLSSNRPKRWNYSAGELQDGWTNKVFVSSNTPKFKGGKAEAHISYRSMDAEAMLAAMRRGWVDDEADLLDYLKQLLAEGELYPFLREEAAIADVPVSRREALKYLRPLYYSEVQASPWAAMAWKELRP